MRFRVNNITVIELGLSWGFYMVPSWTEKSAQDDVS